MKRRFAFRPALTDLECRRLLAVSAYPDAARNALQAAFVAQAETKANDVVFLGDSITQWWGTTGGVHSVGSFAAAFGNLKAADFGIAGDDTGNLLDRIAGGDLKGAPKVVVLMVGVNDLFQGASAAQAASGITSVVTAIHAASPSSKVLLLGLLPTNFPTGNEFTPVNALVPQVNALISKLGTRAYVTYQDPGSLFKQADGNAWPTLLNGSVHPNALGYEILAGEIQPTLVGLLNQSTPRPALPLIGLSPKSAMHAAIPTPTTTVRTPVPIAPLTIKSSR